MAACGILADPLRRAPFYCQFCGSLFDDVSVAMAATHYQIIHKGKL